MPAPGIGEGLGEGDFGGPAEGAADLVGVRVARRNIALATGSDGVWYFDPGFPFKRVYGDDPRRKSFRESRYFGYQMNGWTVPKTRDYGVLEKIRNHATICAV